MNITYLNSPDPAVSKLALTSMALGLLCLAGLAVKTFFDSLGITKTRATGASSDDLYAILVFWGATFGIQFIVFFLILQIPIQSVFDIGVNMFVFAVISSTSEEFFFGYALQPLITRYSKYAGVFAVAGIFMFYHWVVYGSTVLLLIMMFLFRVIYGTIYYYCRRLSVLILAHLLTNLLGLANASFG